MQLTLEGDLAFTRVTIAYRGMETEVSNVLVDTGSASTVMAARAVAAIGVVPELQDTLYTIRGVGGTEAVFTRRIDRLQVGQQSLTAFEIESVGMNYGFEINGILGMDFLLRMAAIIDLGELRIMFPDRSN